MNSRNSRHLIRALVVAVLPLALVALLAPGCGQDVATCDTICTTSGSTCTATVSSDCSSAWQNYQTSCSAAPKNGGGSFQDLLTCIADSNDACNGFANIPPLCDAEASAVVSLCGNLP